MAKHLYHETAPTPKTLVVVVEAPYNTGDLDAYHDEFLSLVETNGDPIDLVATVRLRTIDPAYFLTTGKLTEIKELCEKENVEHVIISESLSGQQERNMSDFLDCSVTDRTRLILEIFEKAAHSAEGKAQVAIARLQYEKTRLAGKGKFLSQQIGVTGVRGGPGETLKERERRHIEHNILKLKDQLKHIQKVRETQRKRRLQSNMPHMALIGYTNAGKSTILNALTKSDVLAEDKLFATLDTTTRELYINSQKKGLLSDTVGFIQYLPTRLIEAFKSTLSELEYADLLLHVIDLSNPDWQAHIRVVHEILDDLGVDKEILYVFNKADKVENLSALTMDLARYQPHVIVSAASKEGLKPLIEFLDEWEAN